MIGSTATSLVARQIGGVTAGPAGAILGLALPFIARRLGPAGMVAMAVGAWAVTKLLDNAAMAETQAATHDEPIAVTGTAITDTSPVNNS
jgi:hypothetical protein